MSIRSAFLAITAAALLSAGITTPSAAADDPALKAQLQRLLDREAIQDLLVTYGRLLDKKDLPAYSKLFAADGVWEGGIGSAKGPREIQQMLETVYARQGADRFGVGAYHIMSDFIVEISGDTATAFSRWTWVVEGKEGTPIIQRSGHYEDKLVREGGRWRFKHRLTVTELPTAARDTESRIFRTDHRNKN